MIQTLSSVQEVCRQFFFFSLFPFSFRYLAIILMLEERWWLQPTSTCFSFYSSRKREAWCCCKRQGTSGRDERQLDDERHAGLPHQRPSYCRGTNSSQFSLYKVQYSQPNMLTVIHGCSIKKSGGGVFVETPACFQRH